jgi:hypothetical protein
MKIKKGAILPGIKIEMRKALKEADKLWKSYAKELVITCGVDGEHSAGSLHYYGYALDFRIRYFPQNIHTEIVYKLKKALGADYDVILHKTHIHVEYDPKKIN